MNETLRANKHTIIEDTKLTVEELRQHKGFEEIKEAEAIQIIDQLHNLCIIIYENYVSTLQPQIVMNKNYLSQFNRFTQTTTKHERNTSSNVVIYTRVSSKDQMDNGASLVLLCYS